MNKHKGFTLMEVLIVLVVMGILASMMMLSSSESVSTARANNIISNLRNFSMAAMALYTDSMDEFGKNPSLLSDNPAKLKSYVMKRMHNEGDIPDIGDYILKNASGTWWAGYHINGVDSTRISEKLAVKAPTANLKGTTTDTPPTKTSTTAYPEFTYGTTKHTYVWILIRSSGK